MHLDMRNSKRFYIYIYTNIYIYIYIYIYIHIRTNVTQLSYTFRFFEEEFQAASTTA
jgi:hypothetical protein